MTGISNSIATMVPEVGYPRNWKTKDFGKYFERQAMNIGPGPIICSLYVGSEIARCTLNGSGSFRFQALQHVRMYKVIYTRIIYDLIF